MTGRLLIVGGGIAAYRLIEKLLQRGADARRITLVCGEPHPPYDRLRLGDVLEGRAPEDALHLASATRYRARGVRLHLGRPAIGIDRAAQMVELADGARLGYDQLVLATGSEPVVAPFSGTHHPNVMTYRTLDDAAQIATAGARVAVVGGGLLGIEAAHSLRRRGRSVTVVHRGPWVLDRQIDPEAATLLQRALEGRGLDILTGAEVVEIQSGHSPDGVRLADGRLLRADTVVLATGARPACRLAGAAGLACRQGIVVDDGLQSSDPRIFALGECADHPRAPHGFVQPIAEQAAVLARRLLGDRSACYQGTVPLATLKVDGIALAFAGQAAAEESLVLRDPGRGIYRRLAVSGGRLRGTVLFGDTREGAWFTELIRREVPIEAIRGELIFGRALVDGRHGPDVLERATRELAPAEEKLAA